MWRSLFVYLGIELLTRCYPAMSNNTRQTRNSRSTRQPSPPQLPPEPPVPPQRSTRTSQKAREPLPILNYIFFDAQHNPKSQTSYLTVANDFSDRLGSLAGGVMNWLEKWYKFRANEATLEIYVVRMPCLHADAPAHVQKILHRC